MIAIREEAERMHGVFMAMTQQLLTGDLEIGIYEDQVLYNLNLVPCASEDCLLPSITTFAFACQVRALLGTNSYELFTLDKLINKLISHMRIMVQVRVCTSTLFERIAHSLSSDLLSLCPEG